MMTVSSRTNKFDAASGGMECEDSIISKPHMYSTAINMVAWICGFLSLKVDYEGKWLLQEQE